MNIATQKTKKRERGVKENIPAEGSPAALVSKRKIKDPDLLKSGRAIKEAD